MCWASVPRGIGWMGSASRSLVVSCVSISKKRGANLRAKGEDTFSIGCE